MLKKQSNTDFDDGPRTLCSHLHSKEIPIPRSSHPSSLSLISNPLQISQSPTRSFITKKHIGQYNTLDMQESCVSANCQNESSLCMSVPQGTPVSSDTTSEEKFSQHYPGQTKTEGKKEMLVLQEKYDDEQFHGQKSKRSTTTEDFGISSDPHSYPLPELLNPQCSDTAPHHNDNPFSTPLSNKAFNPLPVSSIYGATPTPVYIDIPDIPSHMKFFSFVILHVPEDHEIASRVCSVLQKLVIGEGTTFCKEFETPGVNPLSCLEDAVDNSVYIVILLTKGFFSKWGEFQTNAVLMNSITDVKKSGSVIPFFPASNSAVDKLPLCLRTLSSLNEGHPAFDHKVRKTFKEDVIKRACEQWKKEQIGKLLEKRVEELSSQLESLQKFSREYETISNQLSSQKLLLQYNTLSPLLIQGQPPIIQISHASNVQIGNQNSIIVQQPANGPLMDMHGESCEEGNVEAQS